MLVAGRVARDSVGMHAALMGERASTHEWLSRAEIHVGRFVHVARHLGQLGQTARQKHLVSALEGQVGNDVYQIYVATALADTIDSSLDLRGALGDGC